MRQISQSTVNTKIAAPTILASIPLSAHSFEACTASADESFVEYKSRIATSVLESSQTLLANPRYKFEWRPWLGVDPRSWSVECENNFCARATSRPSIAIDSFSNGSTDVNTECFGGMQILLWTTQRRLYGSDFDKAFRTDEVFVAEPETLQSRGSVLGRFTSWDRSFAANDVARGAEAIVGLAGFISGSKVTGFESTASRGGFLGRIRNSASNSTNSGQIQVSVGDQGGSENIVIRKISKAAALQLEEIGGFKQLNVEAAKIWKLTLSIPQQTNLEKETKENILRAAAEGRATTGVAVSNSLAAMLSSPAFQEIEIHVHGLEAMTLGLHLVRQSIIHPESPHGIFFYNSNVNTKLFDRWLTFQRAKCSSK
jgi:hypothetical protein